MMLKRSILVWLTVLCCWIKPSAQTHSFEGSVDYEKWSIDKGHLEVSDAKYKLGKKSLKIEWKSGAVIRIIESDELANASKSKNGGIATWIYNEYPTEKSIILSFVDENNKEVCNQSFNLNFKGWRCLWSKFQEDMGMKQKTIIHSLQIKMPDSKDGGVIYLDCLSFTPNVSWQKMSDAQYEIYRKDFSLVSDFIGYRRSEPDLSKIVVTDENAKGVSEIKDRLTHWYLGGNDVKANPLITIREKEEREYISKGVSLSKNIRIRYDKEGAPAGDGLFPLYTRGVMDGQKVSTFMDINKNVLLPLTLDYFKNGNKESLEKAIYIYDWFNDQGWADGSALGTLCFEKLRSAGYFHSFFLLKDKLSDHQLNRELNTMRWLTAFGKCYQEPEHTGEVADNLRALAIPKLIYALSLTDSKEQQAALSAFSAYMNNSLSFGPGYFGTIKADYSGYHHRGAYNSAYYPHALYAASLVAYLLHDTPYALSDNSLYNLKQALLTFRFFSAGLDVPAGTVGRFPQGQTILQELLPAFAYVAYSYKTPDHELSAAFMRLINKHRSQVDKFVADVNSTLTYTSSVGETELMTRLMQENIKEEPAPTGSLFMPYSGLMVIKKADYHFNIKGFSKYIWDYESSNDENLYGRYISYGQVEFFNLKNNAKSFNVSNQHFDWNYISGTTSKVLPHDVLKDKNNKHRNFSDESFLCGVSGGNDGTAMFSFRLHDTSFDPTFRANKSVFAFNDILLCLGSDICNDDTKHNTVTTICQSPSSEKKARIESFNSGHLIYDDSGMLYAVKNGTTLIIGNEAFDITYLDHGKAPKGSDYHYYIVANNDEKTAKTLLSEDSPVNIIRQNNDAHIVRINKTGHVYAAIFNHLQTFESLPVREVNIPLSYIWEQQNGNNFKLSVCEPDMRRPTKKEMGLLSEEEVIQEEKPFETRLVLSGEYSVENSDVKAKVDYKEGNTIINISTIRGENYRFNLQKKK